jgi:hypothetical protein
LPQHHCPCAPLHLSCGALQRILKLSAIAGTG